MRIAFRIFLLVIGLASSLGPATGRAGELIEFPNLPEHAPASLLGYLARPDAGLSAILGSRSNPGRPYPAVVVLHGCGGISSHSAGIADRIGSWGYVALTVDSLGPRGMTKRGGRVGAAGRRGRRRPPGPRSTRCAREASASAFRPAAEAR
jgi:dienelactone hydrolase family protein